jgi:hypothetical protein
MKLSKRLSDMVFFAAWCKNHNADPALVAELRQLVDANARYWARHYKHSDCHGKRINELFKELGATNVSWPGLFPTFTLNGSRECMLPDF